MEETSQCAAELCGVTRKRQKGLELATITTKLPRVYKLSRHIYYVRQLLLLLHSSSSLKYFGAQHTRTMSTVGTWGKHIRGVVGKDNDVIRTILRRRGAITVRTTHLHIDWSNVLHRPQIFCILVFWNQAIRSRISLLQDQDKQKHQH